MVLVDAVGLMMKMTIDSGVTCSGRYVVSDDVVVIVAEIVTYLSDEDDDEHLKYDRDAEDSHHIKLLPYLWWRY